MPVLAYMQETMISAMLRFLLEMPVISSISGHAFFFCPPGSQGVNCNRRLRPDLEVG